MEIIIERIKPYDEHDRQKWFRLRGYVKGSPESSWLTATIPVAKLVGDTDDVILNERIAKLRADVEEYFANLTAIDSIEARLPELGITDKAKVEKPEKEPKEPKDADVSDPV